jgi:tritrans,polycis-undecaprenyl-diphosphate synthase [geranylgeranyl-diphosphate specific]
MLARFRGVALQVYERLLEREVSGAPTHVAVIQDGNRRYARKRGEERTEGYRAGAETTEAMLRWCRDLDVEELTLYAFSMENFERPPDQREALFDLIEEKLYQFADREEVHDHEVRIRAIGETDRLPARVEHQGRDPPDAGLTRELLVAVDVDLRHRRRGVARDRLDGRLQHLARATPVGVEVDEDDVVVGRQFPEVRRALDADRFVGGAGIRVALGPVAGTFHQLPALLFADVLDVLGLAHCVRLGNRST